MHIIYLDQGGKLIVKLCWMRGLLPSHFFSHSSYREHRFDASMYSIHLAVIRTNATKEGWQDRMLEEACWHILDSLLLRLQNKIQVAQYKWCIKHTYTKRLFNWNSNLTDVLYFYLLKLATLPASRLLAVWKYSNPIWISYHCS